MELPVHEQINMYKAQWAREQREQRAQKIEQVKKEYLMPVLDFFQRIANLPSAVHTDFREGIGVLLDGQRTHEQMMMNGTFIGYEQPTSYQGNHSNGFR